MRLAWIHLLTTITWHRSHHASVHLAPLSTTSPHSTDGWASRPQTKSSFIGTDSWCHMWSCGPIVDRNIMAGIGMLDRKRQDFTEKQCRPTNVTAVTTVRLSTSALIAGDPTRLVPLEPLRFWENGTEGLWMAWAHLLPFIMSVIKHRCLLPRFQNLDLLLVW